MEHIIIGTAGHIDHGKTALIHALTGRDTDTKKEEKDRGISIDLGFTWFDLPDGNRAGIVDVPGHEKFLPNMLSGVYGMDKGTYGNLITASYRKWDSCFYQIRSGGWRMEKNDIGRNP